MDSKPPSPPPYRLLPPSDADTRSAKNTRNQRIPLRCNNHPSYGPILTQNVSVTIKSETSNEGSTPSWKIALIIFGLFLIVHSATDHRTTDEKRRQEKEREKWKYRNSGMHWDEPRPLRCAEYGIREYTAHLLDIPSAFDRLKGCGYMPVTINGITFETPMSCEDRVSVSLITSQLQSLIALYHRIRQGWWHVVFGHWQVSNQTICTPYWDKSFEDVGCTGEGSGKHRLQARLWNLQHGDNWHHMCETTPAVIHGVQYPSPTNCHYKGIIYGMYGIWDIDDPNCLYLVDEARKEYDIVDQTGQE